MVVQNPVQVLGAHPINKYNDNYYVIVRQGDSFKSLSKELEISVGKLAKYNERDKHERFDTRRVYLVEEETKERSEGV